MYVYIYLSLRSRDDSMLLKNTIDANARINEK